MITTEGAVNMDICLLDECICDLHRVLSSLESLASDAPWSKLGYFDATHHDQMEHLFHSFLVSRRVLAQLVLQQKTTTTTTALQQGAAATADSSSMTKNDAVLKRAIARAAEFFDDDDTSTEDFHTLRTLMCLAAAMALFVYEGTLVQLFRNDEIAVAKLNEEFYRSDIPQNTYKELTLECTDATTNGRLRSLECAYLLHGTDRILTHDKRTQDIDDEIHNLAKKADGLMEDLADSSLRNQIRQTKVAERTRQLQLDTVRMKKNARAKTFKGVSRLKTPTAHLIKFTAEQKRDILELLQPGDFVFTYTTGYMSNVFIPGAFKHGITFVGSPEARAEAGLTAEGVAARDDIPDEEASKLVEQFGISSITTAPTTTTGEENAAPDADVIEAVAEGVTFNNLCQLLDTHVNRVLVLRPRISREERTNALIDLFRFLGAKYDFYFNFADASAVVCTEIMYRAFNGKGQLAFDLTKRAGRPTLSADDIVNYYLANPEEESFDFVLLALEDTTSTQHEAKVHVGDDGKDVLIHLMSIESK